MGQAVAAWARTRALDAQAIATGDFDLDAFAQYRRTRILTYSSSVPLLRTVLERFEESSIECVLGYSRVVNNMASVIALQTVTMGEVHGAFQDLAESSLCRRYASQSLPEAFSRLRHLSQRNAGAVQGRPAP